MLEKDTRQLLIDQRLAIILHDRSGSPIAVVEAKRIVRYAALAGRGEQMFPGTVTRYIIQNKTDVAS
jgi:hypothetical protein